MCVKLKGIIDASENINNIQLRDSIYMFSMDEVIDCLFVRFNPGFQTPIHISDNSQSKMFELDNVIQFDRNFGNYLCSFSMQCLLHNIFQYILKNSDVSSIFLNVNGLSFWPNVNFNGKLEFNDRIAKSYVIFSIMINFMPNKFIENYMDAAYSLFLLKVFILFISF